MSDICDTIEKFGKGLGSASRFKLVQALFDGPKTVTELVNLTKQSQPATSQHLKTLKEAGIVLSKRQGQEITYSLNSEHVLKILQILTSEVLKRKPGQN